MRVLIACEFSGVVREAFRALGFDAWSCDIEPTEIPGQHHQGDVRNIINDGWDLMIAHPPCTHLSVSGARWWPMKQQEQADALDFVRLLMDAPIAHIAIENPVGKISTAIRKPEQIIQPYQFGDPESKKTCLWLKGLPKLTHTRVLPKPPCGYRNNQTPSGQNKLPPSADRASLRSRTYQGIAAAMAAQWGAILS